MSEPFVGLHAMLGLSKTPKLQPKSFPCATISSFPVMS